MAWRRKKDRAVSKELLLAAQPLRNPNVSEKVLAEGGLELTVALPRGRLLRWLSGGKKDPIIRRYQLDSLGAEVWTMIDGRANVGAMIERFAAAHQMDASQAESAMLEYLQRLAQRGIMVLALPSEDHGQSGSA